MIRLLERLRAKAVPRTGPRHMTPAERLQADPKEVPTELEVTKALLDEMARAGVLRERASLLRAT